MANNKTTITAPAGGHEIIIERVFDAPREKVWQAYADPELVIQWQGPRNLKGKIDSWDFKPGGRWGYTHTDADGNSYSFHGFNHEIKAPEHLVSTFEFNGVPGHVSMNSAFFEDLGGKTKLKTIALFESNEDRDGMMASGMERGVVEGNERLDELLEKI
ncbi:MAG: ATPase [Candidatus Saccharibacteria bacterium]|nr:ATPase [Candidatus Saccharibacteria bacterium]